MKTKRTVCLGLLLVCLCLSAGRSWAEPVKPPARTAGDKVTLDFRDIELADLIQTISELTGRNFVYDETVRGKATIISPSPMSLQEAYRVFLTVLNVKGYTIVPSGKVNKIIPVKDAKESNLPTDLKGGAEQYVTRLVPLQNLDATIMASTVLPPLIPKTGNLVAYAPSNTLIITDSAANIERLVEIIRELDVPSGLDMLEVIPLQYAAADEVAQVCTQVLTQVTATPRRGRAATNVQTAGGKEVSRIIAYPRTNALVVLGSADDLETIRNIIRQLDRPAAQERSRINVYYLENADAETLAKTLNEILTGIRTKTARTPALSGQPGQPAAVSPEAVTITADKPTNALIINSSPEDYETLKGIIAQLDIKRKQVFVEALILELSMDATERLGASLQGAATVGSDSVVFGTSNLNTGPASVTDLAPATDNSVPTLLGKTIEGILLGGLFNPITVLGPDGQEVTVPAFSALIDISKRDADINILSAPRLLTSDNEEAEIIIGQNVPIITQRLTDTGGSVGLAQSVSVERKDVALTLRFTPQVTEGDLVRLNVYQEITDIAQTSVGDVDQVGPTLTKRLLRNTVLAENGRTVVLGGLIQTNVQETITKTPLLGDIPLLGWLFKRKGTTERKNNLLIFITPHIIKNTEDLAGVTNKSRELMHRFRMEEMHFPRSSSKLELDLLAPAPAPPAAADEPARKP